MTKEELIRNLKYTMEKHKNDKVDTFGTNISLMCKDVLDYLEQQPSDDCVSRKRLMDNYNGVETPVGYRKVVDMEVIKNLPPVTPIRKVGEWITKDGKEQGYDIAGLKTWYKQIMCNKCGFIENAIEGHTGQYNYCPNCGAEMRGSENENDIT